MSTSAKIEPSVVGDAPVLELRQTSRRFGKTLAVDGVTLEVQPGEVFTLLGPSGCGKSTTLRLIAGLEHPDAGEIRLRDRVIASGSFSLPPDQRDLGMVFQSYAIWPHMTVGGNVAFPLTVRRSRRMPRAERIRRVSEVLELVGLGGFEDRPATQLSGGQQQRVALARAIVYRPEVLLLDEPLSNLDAALREQMRLEISRVQRELGIAVVFVTHDQTEALMLSDRVAVMNAGKVEQVGTSVSIYEHPTSPFVRDFLGRVVTFDATPAPQLGRDVVALAGEDTYLTLRPDQLNGHLTAAGLQVTCRVEDLSIDPATTGRTDGVVGVVVEQVHYLGDRLEYKVRSPSGRQLSVFGSRRDRLDVGARANLVIDARGATVWHS